MKYRTHFGLAWIFVVASAFPPWMRAGDRGADAPRTPEAVYGQGVRETEKRSPAEELAGFHLPSGFVAELIASEPQISKPLNMAFDVQGRLWVTDTIEYPYPAAKGTEPRDSIKVLADNDRDGNFESVTTFADGLNIPIGILPVSDGVICYSIPNIMHLRDTDGDGKCDQRRVLLGPFDTSRDTHGMINALRMGDDGWIYACHGFNNQSHVRAADGSEVHMISGNTFRFRKDGSHVEQFTTGQVNPFGMTSDQWGNWYTADCHSKPVTLLVRGGWYESFGRPHDGLGFVPPLMNHLHGSTAICGIVHYRANEFPAEFRHKFYSGNVMTSRINVNRLQSERDRITLVEEPDFMTSDDPWFRPVDLQLGSDGALYVADFYNKIIGHYEVRLDHPDRDRNSGRIWRIVYRGANAEPMSSSERSLPFQKYSLFSKEHLAELGHENATRRQMAVERIFTEGSFTAAQRETLISLAKKGEDRSDSLRISAIWALHRLGIGGVGRLTEFLSDDDSPLVLVAVLRAWEDLPRAALPASTAPLRKIAARHLSSDIPQVAMAAAGALSQHGTAEEFDLLLTEMVNRPQSDSVTAHAMRIAAKGLLSRSDVAAHAYAAGESGNSDARALQVASLLPAIDTEKAAETLMRIASSKLPGADRYREAALRLACKHMTPRFAEPVVNLLRQLDSPSRTLEEELSSDVLDPQLQLATEAMATLRTGKHAVPPELSALIEERFEILQKAIQGHLSESPTKPIHWQATQARIWKQQDRTRQGQGKKPFKFFSSLTLGEAYTGVLSTDAFPCPSQLSFWIVGHDGVPSSEAGKKNYVQLVAVEAAPDQAVLISAAVPRSDTASRVEWDLSRWQGQAVRLECVDGDSGSAFAWLGVGGFSSPELNPPRFENGVIRLAKLGELAGSATAKSAIRNLIDHDALSDAARARLVASSCGIDGRGLGKLLVEFTELRGQTPLMTKELASAFVSTDDAKHAEACTSLSAALAAQMTLSQQTQLARSLLVIPEGRRLLIALFDDGRIALQSLRGLKELMGNNVEAEDARRLADLSDQASAAPSDAEKAILRRIVGFQLGSTDLEKGKLIYEKNCANCHKLRGAGQLVGPQLDGVGVRGPERLAEDVFMPNRNVDKAFRMTSLLMDDDRVLVGLVREEAGGAMQLVGTDGKSVSIDPSKIAMRRDTARSLMPDNFGELLSDTDLANLIHFVMQPNRESTQSR